MLINHMLTTAAQKHPKKRAVWFKKKWITYSELEKKSNQLGNFLASAGIQRGDRVAILFENSFDYVIAYFAVLKIGAVVVSLNTDLRADSLTYMLRNCGARGLLTQHKFSRFLLPTLPKIPRLQIVVVDEVNLSEYQEIGHLESFRLDDVYTQAPTQLPRSGSISIDLAAIVYTSGSTGEPKGVMLSHLNLSCNMHSIISYLHLTAQDRIMVVLPFSYIYGKSLLLSHFMVGGSLVIENHIIYPNVVLKTMQETGVTGLAGVPATFASLLNRASPGNFRFPQLRYVTQAGGAMAPVIQQAVARIFTPAKLYVMYGTTEAAPRLSYLEPAMLHRKRGSVGKAIPDVELFIGDENGNRLPAGETGEIIARGANLFCGYWQDKEATEKVLRNGMYFTGDLGRMDDEGYLYIVGRARDLINVKGYRVSAKEVEEKLLELNQIQEIAAVAVEDPELGEAIKLFVVLREGASIDADEILEFCKQCLPVFKQPRYVEFIGELPKTKAGKVLKTRLAGRPVPQPDLPAALEPDAATSGSAVL